MILNFFSCQLKENVKVKYLKLLGIGIFGLLFLYICIKFKFFSRKYVYLNDNWQYASFSKIYSDPAFLYRSNMFKRKNIVVDVSHLNEESFWDVAQIAKKPFIATHSNAYDICNHVRNLKTDQIREIRNVGGIIGLNFYKLFLEDNCKNGVNALIKHIDYFLKQKCEDILAIGSDFDGADMPDDIKDITFVPTIKQHISRCFGEDIANKIMFENAKRFFDKTFN